MAHRERENIVDIAGDISVENNPDRFCVEQKEREKREEQEEAFHCEESMARNRALGRANPCRSEDLLL